MCSVYNRKALNAANSGAPLPSVVATVVVGLAFLVSVIMNYATLFFSVSGFVHDTIHRSSLDLSRTCYWFQGA